MIYKFTLEEVIIIIFASLVGFFAILLIITYIISKILKHYKKSYKAQNRTISRNYSKEKCYIQKYHFEQDAIQLKNIKSIKVNHCTHQKSRTFQQYQSPRIIVPPQELRFSDRDRVKSYGDNLEGISPITRRPTYPQPQLSRTRLQTRSQNRVPDRLRSYGSVANELESMALHQRSPTMIIDQGLVPRPHYHGMIRCYTEDQIDHHIQTTPKNYHYKPTFIGAQYLTPKPMNSTEIDPCHQHHPALTSFKTGEVILTPIPSGSPGKYCEDDVSIGSLMVSEEDTTSPDYYWDDFGVPKSEDNEHEENSDKKKTLETSL